MIVQCPKCKNPDYETMLEKCWACNYEKNLDRKFIKKYRVVDCQGCYFMDDTYDEPMTMNALRARFWSLDDCRSITYAQFTRDYISDMWTVKFEEVK